MTAQARELVHADRCRNGWLGLDRSGLPVSCPLCRPQLDQQRCPGCRSSLERCVTIEADTRCRCCAGCAHPVRVTLAQALTAAEVPASTDLRPWGAVVLPPDPRNPGRRARLVVTTRDTDTVLVWWRPDRATSWRCVFHGASRDATCEHIAAAAVAIAALHQARRSRTLRGGTSRGPAVAC